MSERIVLDLPIDTKIDEVKARWLECVLEKCGGDAKKVAKITGTPLPSVYRILARKVKEA
jgi:hypothetical protein